MRMQILVIILILANTNSVMISNSAIPNISKNANMSDINELQSTEVVINGTTIYYQNSSAKFIITFMDADNNSYLEGNIEYASNSDIVTDLLARNTRNVSTGIWNTSLSMTKLPGLNITFTASISPQDNTYATGEASFSFEIITIDSIPPKANFNPKVVIDNRTSVYSDIILFNLSISDDREIRKFILSDKDHIILAYDGTGYEDPFEFAGGIFYGNRFSTVHEYKTKIAGDTYTLEVTDFGKNTDTKTWTAPKNMDLEGPIIMNFSIYDGSNSDKFNAGDEITINWDATDLTPLEYSSLVLSIGEKTYTFNGDQKQFTVILPETDLFPKNAWQYFFFIIDMYGHKSEVVSGRIEENKVNTKKTDGLDASFVFINIISISILVNKLQKKF